MPSPSNTSPTSFVRNSGNIIIDALLDGEKWGSSYGGYTKLNISYSFPWVNSSTAVFMGPDGRDYSPNGEQNATYRFGLNNTQQVAANLALAAWSNVANINFQFLQETSTNVGDIRFAFTSASSISDVWGYAWTPDDYWPSAGDIWINADNGNDEDWSVGSYNYESLIHEIGHALGLKHPFTGNVKLDSDMDNKINTIMSYTGKDNLYIDFIYIETPMVFDIAAIQYMYGANNNYNVGDDIYSFDPNKPFYKTIWDAGGNDTISAANFSLDCIIDLTPGSYSSLRYQPLSIYATYEGNNNLGIAFNCVIENTIGGSGNDILVGNFANNNLYGGAGNDSIYGGEGNDLIFGDGGNNLINGGTGYDYAGYAANKSTIKGATQTASGDVIIRTAFGTDTLIDIEAVVFSNGVLTIDELVIQYQPPPFQTGAGIVQATIYDGPVDFLDFILIDDTQNAIVAGTNYNDFIKLSNTNSAGKAVDGGGGDDVIDGGVGSTFISGGGGSNTFFLDGRASGVSWSTITDFAIGVDKATIWGWKQGISKVAGIDAPGGADGYKGLTLHFENLLPSDASITDKNSNLNSITFSDKTLSDFGVSSVEALNAQIAAGDNQFFMTGQTVDDFGTHGYLYIA